MPAASESPRDDPRFPSGTWTGFYQQWGRDRNTSQDMHFAGGRVTGAGRDRAGAFTLSGRYDTATGVAEWTKIYPAHAVAYRGFAEQKSLWGTWELETGTDRGGFRLWPEKRGTGVVSTRTRTSAPVAGTGDVDGSDTFDRLTERDRADALEPIGAG